MSPFVVAAQEAGLGKLADAVNGILLVFTVSAANSDIYLASRTIWALSKDGQAPKVTQRTNSHGVPTRAVVLSSIFIVLGFISVSTSAATVLDYCVSLVTVFGAINWVAVLVSYIAMVRAMRVQKVPRSALPYRNPLLPWGAYVALILTVLVIFFSGYSAFIPRFQIDKFLTSYIGIPVYVVNILWWKLVMRTTRVNPAETELTGELKS